MAIKFNYQLPTKKDVTAPTNLPTVQQVIQPLLRQGQTAMPANLTRTNQPYTGTTGAGGNGGGNGNNGKPQYDPSWDEQMAALLSQIQGRGPFQYDAQADPLYNIYRDIYMQNGRRAMEDTMGQAAALTGGYGNSYAQSAGQQQYNQYMEGLNAMVPTLQQQAYEQYQGEDARLAQVYQMLANESDRGYSRYQDALARWDKEHQSSGSGSAKKKTEGETGTGNYIDKLRQLLQGQGLVSQETAPTITNTTPTTESIKHPGTVTYEDQIQAILRDAGLIGKQENYKK